MFSSVVAVCRSRDGKCTPGNKHLVEKKSVHSSESSGIHRSKQFLYLVPYEYWPPVALSWKYCMVKGVHGVLASFMDYYSDKRQNKALILSSRSNCLFGTKIAFEVRVRGFQFRNGSMNVILKRIQLIHVA